MQTPLLLLGVGQVGLAVATACGEARRVIGTTRQPQRLFELFDRKIEPIVMPWPSAEVIAPLASGADVVVSFPPDGTTDAILAPVCLSARSVVYISSTVVYGRRQGTIDDSTPADEEFELSLARIEAEKIWRSIGACVLRAPAIYGGDDRLYRKIIEGQYFLPGDGSNFVSRIHLDDLAKIILAVGASGKREATYVVGDLEPARQRDVVEWLCQRLSLPMPASIPIEQAHYTQRSDRRINASRLLSDLDITLKFPSYKQGYESLISDSLSN